MPPRLLAKIMRTLSERYGLAQDFECTLEMDPGTFDAERLAAFLDAGVTRVSLGVQSFDQALLTACGRAHTMEDAERALELLGSMVKAPLGSAPWQCLAALGADARASRLQDRPLHRV